MARNDTDPNPEFEKKAQPLAKDLAGIATTAKALQDTGLEALGAQSLIDLQEFASTGQTILKGLVGAHLKPSPDDALERADALLAHLGDTRMVDRLREDLPEAAKEAVEEAASISGGRKARINRLIRTIPDITDALLELMKHAAALRDDTIRWHAALTTKEDSMATKDKQLGGIETVLHDISRQIGFIGTNVSAQSGAQTTSGAGNFRNVGAQLMASLDALSLPRGGVQFADDGRVASASDMLIDGLLDNYRPVIRNGITVYEPGRTEGRAPSRLVATDALAGASRVAARLVRSEGDVILDILDRLPNMMRFEPRAGAPSLRQTRDRVADQFDALDETMADALGVNLPKATSIISRAVKATADYLDYANLEPEFFAEMRTRDLDQFISIDWDGLSTGDETALRRAVVQSEEIRGEIRELTEAYGRLNDYVGRPLDDTLGRTAARLDRQLLAINRSARDLQSTLARFGTSQAEQDLMLILNEANVPVEKPKRRGQDPYDDKGKAKKIDISVSQLISWIVKTSEDGQSARGRVTVLEALDLGILRDELEAQATALNKLADSDDLRPVAFGLGAVMRQLEELQLLVSSAAKNAAALAKS